MKLGIVGLPGVGKTTLFNALTGLKAETGGYTSAAAKPNIGQAKVPDERLDWLFEFYKPKKYSPASIDFVDVAGVTKGSGKNSPVLQAVRMTDAIVHVVRCFDNPNLFSEPADSRGDAESLDLDLILTDMDIIERRLERAQKNAKGGDKKYKYEIELCERLLAHLSDGKPARSFPFSDGDRELLTDSGLLSAKPVIFVANMDEDGFAEYSTHPQYLALKELADEQGAAIIHIAAKFEEDIRDMDDEDAQMFMEELGIEERGLDRLIKASYALLGYISFLTGGPDDVHAWTITKGTKAPKAAGKIHSDIERGFIRAEVVAFNDLKACGSIAAAKAKGLFRLEGKDYVMCDGDVVNFLFNV